MRLTSYLFIIALFYSFAPAATADNTGGKVVEIMNGNRHYSAVLFEPNGAGPFPALVEIHGIYGVDNFDNEVSRKLGEAGYVTLEIDLYGRSARTYEDGLHLRDEVRPHLREDLVAAADYLRSLKEVTPTRVGAIGWCMGGGFALQLAIADARLAAVVMYYGPVVVDQDELRNIHAHLLGYFGQEDRSISVPGVRMMANSLKEVGNPMELHIIPGARHGFAQPDFKGSETAYMPEVAAHAWEETLGFLRANLAGNSNGL